MIGLDNDAGLNGLNQMSGHFNHLYKTWNLNFRWPVIFFGGGEEPKKKEKWFDWVTARLTALSQIFIVGGMKDNYSKFKLFEGVQVNPQGFVGVVMYKSWGVAQGLLNSLEWHMLLGSRVS